MTLPESSSQFPKVLEFYSGIGGMHYALNGQFARVEY